jgi:hypothetical protein
MSENERAKFWLPSDVQTDSPKIKGGAFSKIHERKATFGGLLMLQSKSVDDLAKSGFYCVGKSNKRIVCVGCKFTFSCLDLGEDEDPKILHLMTYPGCSMVKDEDLDFHFRNLAERKATFPADWKSRCPVSHNDMADAGFCYAGPRDEQIDLSDRNKDKVICYSCRKSKNQWKLGDNPRQEHQPSCGFLFGSGGTPMEWTSSGYRTASRLSSNQNFPEPSEVWLDYAEGRNETESRVESSFDLYETHL